MIHGRQVLIGESLYIVPPFNIDMLERLDALDRENAPDKTTTIDLLKHIGPLVVENVQRNYPQLDLAAVMKDMDAALYVELRAAGFATKRETAPNPTPAPVTPSTGAA